MRCHDKNDSMFTNDDGQGQCFYLMLHILSFYKRRYIYEASFEIIIDIDGVQGNYAKCNLFSYIYLVIY